MNINEIMLIVADEIARSYGYILTDERVISGKKDWFWGNREGFPDAQVKSRTYILPAWEDEQEREDYFACKIYLDMYWGKPRLHVRYPDGTSCCLTYGNEGCFEAQSFGPVGLSKAFRIQERIDELNTKGTNKKSYKIWQIKFWRSFLR